MESPVELLDVIEKALGNTKDYEQFLTIMIRRLGNIDGKTDQELADAMYDFCAEFLEM